MEQQRTCPSCHAVTEAQNYCPVCGTRLAERMPIPGTSLVILGAVVVLISVFLAWFRATGFAGVLNQPYTLEWDAFSSHAFLAACLLVAMCANLAIIAYARYRRPIAGRYQDIGPLVLGGLAVITAAGILLAVLARTNIPDEVALYRDPHIVAGGYVALGGFLVMACGVARLAVSGSIGRRSRARVAV